MQKIFFREQEWVKPIEVFERFRGKNSFLLHSPNFGAQSRYSFIGCNPFLVFESRGKKMIVNGVEKSGNPITELKKILNSFKTKNNPKLPPFQCGAAGYLGYDIVHFFEKLPRKAKNDLNLPDCYFVFVDKMVAFDNLKNKIYLISMGERKSEGKNKLDELEDKFLKNIMSEDGDVKLLSPITSNFTKHKYIEAIKKVKEYVYAGDTFQVNLSQRFCAKVEADPFDIYKKLIKINPSPFSAFLDFQPVKLISSSPERLVKLSGRTVETRPIAGTRKRGKDRKEDKMLEMDLIKNEKERAEHTMLVDLERNDIGKVCDYGSVKVTEKMIVEKYSHVMHLVSNVTGRLFKTNDRFDLIEAVFPGGTVTGCPKIRTMEIIDELEPVRRGPYTGSIGYFSFSGNMDMNIIIRTFVVKGKRYYIQVGGGIVADSIPKKEWEETIHKARGLFEVIGEKNAADN